MHVRDLSPREQLHLCGLAEQHCARLLRCLARRARARLPGLSRILAEMAADEEAHEREIVRAADSVDWPGQWDLTRDAAHELLRRHFPACLRNAERVHPSEEEVLAFVEELEGESGAFYRHLAEQASDPGLRGFYLDLMRREEAHMRRPLASFQSPADAEEDPESPGRP